MTSHPPRDLSHSESVQLVSYTHPEDEIDLIYLWRLIMSKKHLLALGLVLVWSLAAVWFLFTKPAYEVETSVLPATPQMLAELAIIDSEKKYEPLIVFKRYLNNFISVRNKRHFFDESNLLTYFVKEDKTPDQQDDIFTGQFSEKLELIFDQKRALPESAKARFKLDNGDQAAQWLDQYASYIHQITLDLIFSEIEERTILEKKNLKDQIAIKIVFGKQQRDDQIARLEEALKIAGQLGIRSVNAFSIANEQGQTAVEVNTQHQPLYTRGVEALNAELEALKSRKDDEPFIGGLRALEEKLARLEMLKPDKNRTRVVIIDQQANIPEQAKNKKRPLILVSSTMLGLFVGLLMIFLQRFFKRVRDAEAIPSTESP